MKNEITEVRVAHRFGEPWRRWFRSDSLDLIVWFSWWGWGPPIGFQIAYDKAAREGTLTWTRERGFEHRRERDVKREEPDGLLRYYEKAKLGQVIDEHVNVERLTLQFERVAPGLPPKFAALVMGKLSELKSSSKNCLK